MGGHFDDSTGRAPCYSIQVVERVCFNVLTIGSLMSLRDGRRIDREGSEAEELPPRAGSEPTESSPFEGGGLTAN